MNNSFANLVDGLALQYDSGEYSEADVGPDEPHTPADSSEEEEKRKNDPCRITVIYNSRGKRTLLKLNLRDNADLMKLRSFFIWAKHENVQPTILIGVWHYRNEAE